MLNRKYVSSNVKLKMNLEESIGICQAKKGQKYAPEKGVCMFVCISLPIGVKVSIVYKYVGSKVMVCGNVVGEIGNVYDREVYKLLRSLNSIPESNGKLMDYLRLEKNYFSSSVEDELLGREEAAKTGHMEKPVIKLIK